MANPILEKLLALKTGIGICWLGNLGWLIRAEGRLLAFDLDLDRDSRLQPSPIATEELAPVGYPDELKATLPESLQTCFHKLDQGDVFHIA